MPTLYASTTRIAIYLFDYLSPSAITIRSNKSYINFTFTCF